MPRRTGRRCPERTAAADLDALVAWELSGWRGVDIPGIGLETLEDFSAAWRAHREKIRSEFIAAMPGARPFASYVTGELATPPIIERPYPSDTGRRIGGVVFFDARAYGIADEAELEHLLRLGLVDADEEAAARRRIAHSGPRDLYRFNASTAGDAYATA